MTDQLFTTPLAQADDRVTIRRIRTEDVWDAFRRGLADFMAMPSHAVFLVLIYPIVGLVIGFMTANEDLIPLLFPLVAGFAMLGPIAALGLYEISRRREQGQKVSAGDALGVLRSPSLTPIIELSGLLMVLFVAWLVTAMLINRLILGSVSLGEPLVFLRQVVSTPQGWLLIVVGNVVGFGFAAVAFALGAVSFPMLLDRKVSLRTAVQTSLRCLRENPRPMAVWGLTIAVLMALGSVPFFIGLAVVLPVLGHATWHMYRKLVA